jgi:acetyl esterase/lipase
MHKRLPALDGHPDAFSMQGTVLDMVEDVSTALQWVTDNVHAYGGDPQRTVVVGQSAGGQLAALAVLFQVHSVPH